MKRLLKVVLFVIIILVLQQGIHYTSLHFFQEEREVIDTNNMDPALFFYTDSEHAMTAEKEVRELINEQ